MEILNRKAKHDYFIDEALECGIVLKGTEIKSIRKGSANLKDCYARIKDGEVFLVNMYIAPYEEGNLFNHEETRTRKLLLKKSEILKLQQQVDKNGYTLVPLRIYFSNQYAKVEIGLAKGKKLYDKREDITKKTQNRDIQRKLKNY